MTTESYSCKITGCHLYIFFIKQNHVFCGQNKLLVILMLWERILWFEKDIICHVFGVSEIYSVKCRNKKFTEL